MRRTIALALSCLALAAVAARAQQPLPAPPEGDRSVLRPGDVVQLEIWREKDLTGKFDVDEHGAAVLPKIGRVQVAGVDPETLKAQIITEYQRYLRNPSITVTFLRRVTILGSVSKPGVYPVDPTMTIADALALAGGASPDGQRDRVQLYREGKPVEGRLSQGTRIADSPIRSGDQLFVPERSWISRNQGLVATAISAVVSLLIAFRPF